jgi:hypothetical protein
MVQKHIGSECKDLEVRTGRKYCGGGAWLAPAFPRRNKTRPNKTGLNKVRSQPTIVPDYR